MAYWIRVLKFSSQSRTGQSQISVLSASRYPIPYHCLYRHIYMTPKKHTYTKLKINLNFKKGVQGERVSVLFAEIPHLWLP